MRALRFTRQMAAQQESRNDTGSNDSLQARLHAPGAIVKIDLSVRGSLGVTGADDKRPYETTELKVASKIASILNAHHRDSDWLQSNEVGI